MTRSWDNILQSPETISISLSRLISRLESKVLSAENEPLLVRSELEREKSKTNLEYARTLLLRLEHDSSSIKIQSRKQTVQRDLQSKRERIKLLNHKLQELEQLAADEEDAEDEEGDDDDTCSQLESPAPPSAALSSGGIDTGQTQVQRGADVKTSATLRSRGSKSTEIPTATTGSTLFPPNFQPPRKSTNVDVDPNLSQTEALLSHNRSEQENLTDSLLHLASQFKASALQFSSSLESEKDVLGRAASGLDRNALGMEAAGQRMSTLRRMTEGKGWLARLKIYGLIGGLWIVAFLVVFVMPKLRF